MACVLAGAGLSCAPRRCAKPLASTPVAFVSQVRSLFEGSSPPRSSPSSRASPADLGLEGVPSEAPASVRLQVTSRESPRSSPEVASRELAPLATSGASKRFFKGSSDPSRPSFLPCSSERAGPAGPRGAPLWEALASYPSAPAASARRLGRFPSAGGFKGATALFLEAANCLSAHRLRAHVPTGLRPLEGPSTRQRPPSRRWLHKCNRARPP